MSIFETLQKLNLSSIQTRKLFSNGTRDVDKLKVWKDELSGVIFIDKYYTGVETYREGDYKEKKVLDLKTGKPDFERHKDAERRCKDNLQYLIGKKIVDFGCGRGDFLRNIQPYCESVCGIEPDKNYLETLKSDHINCYETLSKIKNDSIDALVSFHVLEHLQNPIETLSEIKRKIIKGGRIIIEVPHANDFLISVLPTSKFINFTLWSQHLILHTRESLRRLLTYTGFKNIKIKGVQRYPLSNHFNWLANGKPGGHKSDLSVLDNAQLKEAYANSLAKIDATDTLIAIASVD